VHVEQAPPFFPQKLFDCGSHVLPLQQPFGHEAAVHAQLAPAPLPVHWSPALQVAPVPPQEQTPPTQELAVRVLHAKQVTPPLPHPLAVSAPGAKQSPWESQQPAQLFLLHDFTGGSAADCALIRAVVTPASSLTDAGSALEAHPAPSSVLADTKTASNMFHAFLNPIDSLLVR
jgi:hypothetical protein